MRHPLNKEGLEAEVKDELASMRRVRTLLRKAVLWPQSEPAKKSVELALKLLEEDRCGSMREGGDMQCIYSAGHSGLHQWGSLPTRAFDDEQDRTGDEEGSQEMPQVPSDSRCQVQGQEIESSKHPIRQSS